MSDDNIIHLPLRMPAPLARQVAALSLPPDPEMAGFLRADPRYDPAAADWLRRKRELIKQSGRDQCHDWLAALIEGINGVTEKQFNGRVAAIWLMCGDLPDLVWCEATMAAIWARTPFMPTPGECREVLEAYAAPFLAEISALERIAAAPKQREVAREAAEPYVPTPTPTPAVPEPAPSRAVPPVRTVAEQLAALTASLRLMDSDPGDA